MPKIEKSIIENFLESLISEKGLSKNTIESYKSDINQFLERQTTSKSSELIFSRKSIEKYISMMNDLGFERSTILRKLSSLGHFFDFLVTENILKDNPFSQISIPKKNSKLPVFLTNDQVDRLLETAKNDDSIRGLRLLTMIEILYATGIRVSELVGLKLSSLYEKENFIFVTGKGNKERLVPVDQNTLSTIEKYLKVRVEFLNADKNEDKWLFPSRNSKLGHISRQRFHQLLKVLCKEANIDAKYVSPHKLRHAFASHLLANGMDLRSLQMLLGHSDISTTQIYTHVLSDRLKSTVEDNHPLSKVFKE